MLATEQARVDALKKAYEALAHVCMAGRRRFDPHLVMAEAALRKMLVLLGEPEEVVFGGRPKRSAGD